MKIERSSSTRGDATITPAGLRRLVCSLFLVAAVALVNVDAVGAVAFPRANEGRAGVGNALPATTIAVTNTNDSGPGSLRNALAVANDGDTIDATGVSGAILLTSGELQISRNVTINGPGAGTLTVNGNGTFRVFNIETSDAIISGFTITNGLAADGRGGGGILNLGGVTLSDSVVSNCSALSGNNPYGGAISTFAVGHVARLTVSNCTISGNSAEVGGAIESVALAFQNAASSVVTVSNSTLRNNSATQYGGAIYDSASGPHSVASLSITNSTINDNHAGCEGGGIDNSNAQLTVTNSTISGNTAHTHLGCGGNGGGIFYNGGGTVMVTNSAITGNSAGAGGGMGSDLPGGTTATVTNTTISGNFAGFEECETCGSGGGIVNYGQTLTVTSSTISDNGTQGYGGGLVNSGSITLANSTISGNSGGRLANSSISNGGNLAVTNCTLSDNAAFGIFNAGAVQIGDTVLNAGASGGTIFNNGGTVISLGYNLASDNGGGVLTGPGDQINTDPMLGPLQDNGGPTFTHTLLNGSSAIDAGDPNFTPPPDYDQRGPGFDRVVNGRIDIGAFEVQIVTPTLTGAVSRKTHGGAGSFDVPLPLTGSPGVECRTTRGTNDYAMVVTFASNVTVTGSPQAEVTLGTGCVGSGGACSGNVSVSGNTVTVPLTNIANVQVINVRLNGVNSAAMDAPATDFTIPMGILVGDTNGNRTVNAADVAQTKRRLGQIVDATNFRSDVNANGSINAGDTAIVKQNSGMSLPP